MSFVRMVLSQIVLVPFLSLTFNPAFDLTMSASDFLSAHSETISVDTPQITVHFERLGSRVCETTLRNVHTSDRVFDLKQQFFAAAGVEGVNRFKFLFFVGDVELIDQLHLSQCGVYDGSTVLVCYIATAFCSLSFSDTNQKQHVRLVNLSKQPHCTLAKFLPKFSPDPLTVAFEYDGQLLKASTEISSHLWDPQMPICWSPGSRCW
jgi:hypothetical protein